MSCRDSSDEDVNMQELPNHEKALEIIEEDITALATRKKAPRDVLETQFETWVSMFYLPIKMNCSWGKLLVMMIKKQQ